MKNLAIIGCGHIHIPGFIRAIKSRPDELSVKCVWDHIPARGKQRADELGAAFIGEYQTALTDAAIDAAVICSETDRHHDLVLATAAAKKDLFVEKPLGFAAKDAKLMADAIDKAGVKFQTGYFMRGLPQHLFLKEQIEKGTFGKITRIRGSNCHSGAIGGWFDTEWRWMADPKIAGCGAFGDLGTHLLDIMIWLMGDVVSVTGTMNTGTARYGECDETGEAILKFKNGAIGTLAAAWDDVANPVSLLISGTNAHAAVIEGNLYFTLKGDKTLDGKSPMKDLPPAKHAGFEAYLDAITGKEATLVTAKEAAYRSSVMEAIYEGANHNNWEAPR